MDQSQKIRAGLLFLVEDIKHVSFSLGWERSFPTQTL